MFNFLSEYYQMYIDATITTLEVSFLALVIGLILGVVICIAKIGNVKIFSWLLKYLCRNNKKHTNFSTDNDYLFCITRSRD